jgi:transposase
MGPAWIAEKGYLDQIVERRRKSRLPGRVQDELIRQFVAGATARTAADSVGVNRLTATLCFHKLRELIALKLAETEPCLSGEMDVDESYCGGSRKGKRRRGVAGEVRVLGLLKRGGKAYVVIIPNARQNTRIPIIRKTIEPDSIVYADGFFSYHALDVSGFRHHRINHSWKFVEARNHISGIKNFRNRAKRHVRRFSGIPGEHFHLFVKECEWRFNYRPTARLHKTLLVWAKLEVI